MREIKEIHIHCSATKEGLAITAQEIRKWHLARGWSDIGYNYVVGFQGVETGRPLHRIPASVKSRNSNAVALAYIGGLDINGKPKDTRTPRQKELIIKLIKQLKGKFPKAKIYGHRDLSPDKNKDGKITSDEWLKSCPCFDAIEEYMEFQPASVKKKYAK
tara:strand:+ start:1542 stop:2021 length:480 start_codon:yes stop_codon:yes gene_type:complete